jgi:hypothetical protein
MSIDTKPTSPGCLPTGPPCDECGVAIVAEYLPKHESRNLCMGCLDKADPMWREKQLGIKVIDTRPTCGECGRKLP